MNAALDTAVASNLTAVGHAEIQVAHELFVCAAIIHVRGHDTRAVLIGVTTSVSFSNGPVTGQTVFLPLAEQFHPTAASNLAQQFAASFEDAFSLRSDGQCNLGLAELASLSCSERCDYDKFCNGRLCDLAKAAADLLALGGYGTAAVGCLLTGPGYLVCMAAATLALTAALAANKAGEALCKIGVARAHRSCLAGCPGIVEQ